MVPPSHPMIDFSKLKNCVKIENFITCSKRFTKNKSTKVQVNLNFTNAEEIIKRLHIFLTEIEKNEKKKREI